MAVETLHLPVLLRMNHRNQCCAEIAAPIVGENNSGDRSPGAHSIR